MTKRMIVLEDVWCDESDKFWEDKGNVQEMIYEVFRQINWEIGKVEIITEELQEI